MGDFGTNRRQVQNLIERAGRLTIDDAADIYQARAIRLMQDGEASQRALATARRVAARTRRTPEYERARHAAATAFRGALPEVRGPWLVVGAAIANAAGALVLEDVLDGPAFRLLVGPWQQAMGRLVPVGPGSSVPRRQLEAGRPLR